MDLMERRYDVMVGSAFEDANWYRYGDRTFTSTSLISQIKKPIPLGKYKISAVVTSSDTDASKSLFRLLDDNEEDVGDPVYLDRSVNGERSSGICTTTATATRIYIYASDDDSNSNGDTATFAKIRIEKIR